jgi:hypothetical protein
MPLLRDMAAHWPFFANLLADTEMVLAKADMAIGARYAALFRSVGCSTDRRGMCNAGLITGGVSAIGLYLSIDLLRRSLPRVYVGPAPAVPYAAGNTVGLAGRF